MAPSNKPRGQAAQPSNKQAGREAAHTDRKRQEPRQSRAPRLEEPEAPPGEPEDVEGEKLRSDCGPWIEPSSTRVEKYRYDYMTRQIHMTWANHIGPGHYYEVGDYEIFRRLARSSSKGKFVNRVLNGYHFDKIDPTIRDLPSNPQRRAPSGTR